MRLRRNGKRKIQTDRENDIQRKGKKVIFRDIFKHLPPVLACLVTSLIIIHTLSPINILGSLVLTGGLFYIFYRDIKRYRPDYIKKYRMILLVVIMVPFTLLLARGFHYFFINFSEGIGLESSGAVLYGMPIAIGAVIVTLIFDFHTAIIFSFTTSLLSGIWTLEPLYPVYAFLGSLVGSFAVVKCKKRTDLLKAGLYISITNIVALTGIILFKRIDDIEFLRNAYLYASMSGIVVSAMVSIILPVIENLFKVSTDITLLELLDLNHPLMKNLMIAAPGTYHHSIIVGNLVESVAEDIGVNPLLARVSAYYHDIGKIKMPEYFIENLTGTVSKHDRLTPHMSSIILASHVKEGVEIAREFKLPEAVIDVIQQHHGTCLMTYFYQKAKDTADTEPKEEDYRYHGPKPKTRVAALVMLADAVEAASRVLKDPTPARIEALVDRIVNHIFIDGQLENCELTLRDISLIKKRFTYILTGILHRRVDYPGFDFEEKVKRHEGAIKRQAAKGKFRQERFTPSASKDWRTSGSPRH
jgi:hypothetical protein